MNIKKAAVSFLVMDLGTSGNPWNLFCGCDPEKNRIVFFKKLRLRSTPNYFSQEPVLVTVNRDNQVFSSGSPQLAGPNHEAYQLDGLREICGVNHSTDQLDAFHFNDGDIVTIEKSDWVHDENPIDTLATRRTVGTPFKDFTFASPEALEKFSAMCKSNKDWEAWTTTTIVIEDLPGPQYLIYF